MERYYFKCTFCERPIAINCERSELNKIAFQKCPLCNEQALRFMGRVQKTDIVRAGLKAACDLRCTNAVGPKCDCVCVNHNHGTKRLVVYNTVVCKLEVVEKDMLNGNEDYLVRIRRMATAKNSIKEKVLAFLKFKNKDIVEFLKTNPYYKLSNEDWSKYSAYKKFLERIDDVEDLKSIQRKVNTLAKMIPQIGSNLEYMEALYDHKLEKV